MKKLLKKLLAKGFHIGQRVGVDVLPRHFYSEVPVIHQLRKTDHWRSRYSLVGMKGSNADEQLAFVREAVTPPILERLRGFDVHQHACQANGAGGFGPIESQMLYAFVRKHRPQRIIQIGCGVSTAICLAAAADENYQPTITCIEPYPTDFLAEAARENRIRLVQQPVELVPLDYLNDLHDGDLFFIDSTHTLGPAGEVTRLILEALPRIGGGVFVHFHDIWLPFDFSPMILDESLFFWHETALLMAFLCMNPRFHIRASLSLLHHDRLDEFSKAFVDYQPMKFDRGIRTAPGHYPTSIYLQVANSV